MLTGRARQRMYGQARSRNDERSIYFTVNQPAVPMMVFDWPDALVAWRLPTTTIALQALTFMNDSRRRTHGIRGPALVVAIRKCGSLNSR